MLKKLSLILILVLIFILTGWKAAPRPRYVSAWVTIPPGQTFVFEHGLKGRPLLVQVWVAVPLLGQEDLEDVRPWTELPEHPLFVADVTAAVVMVENHGDIAWTVQVVAEP